MTATEVASLAVITGWRTGSFITDVTNWTRVVTMPSALISVKGSMKDFCSRNSRVPLPLYGYVEDDSFG